MKQRVVTSGKLNVYGCDILCLFTDPCDWIGATSSPGGNYIVYGTDILC